MNKARLAYYVVRYLGPGWVWQRARIAMEQRRGTQRRVFAPRPWEAIALAEVCKPGTPVDADGYAAFKREQSTPFLFPLGAPPQLPAYVTTLPAAEAGWRTPPLDERIALGARDRAVYFFQLAPDAPVDWHASPITGGRAPADRDWHAIADFDPKQGDIRTLWEPGRAGWALDFARAAAREPARRAELAAHYWRWVESWMSACQPWKGVQWKCGQESAVRFIALAVSFWALHERDWPAARWETFARIAWATGYRIAHHIHYAVSQGNNHALSEATGLLLISQLFPEFRESSEWRRTARKVLESQLRRQIASDGSYMQHSLNYQRVAVQISTLALRLFERAAEPLPRDVYERVGRCGEFLFQMTDPKTGRAPNYGHNDGAWALPLDECDFRDFRGAVQAAHWLAKRERRLAPGPWDEDLYWLFAGEAEQLESDAVRADETTRRPPPQSMMFTDGGYHTIRRGETWLMTRAQHYTQRPFCCDNLHVDLWWRGLNIARDCGTWRYFAPDVPETESYFKGVRAHNCVQIDNAEPMEAVSRFMYFPWSSAGLAMPRDLAANTLELVGRDYVRAPWGVTLRRTIVAIDDAHWLVVDDILGGGRHRATLRWHLLDAPLVEAANLRQTTLETASGAYSVTLAASIDDAPAPAIIRGVDGTGAVQGWESEYYGERRPIPVIEWSVRTDLPLRLLTVLGPGSPATVVWDAVDDNVETWRVTCPDSQGAWSVQLSAPTIVGRVHLATIKDEHGV